MDWLNSLGFLGEALRFLILMIEVIIVFNLMILVHEYGHFLAGRWRGLKIEKFQIWFGKPLWKKTINGVQYGLGSIPAGGFVALPQMAPMDAIEGKADEPREQLPPITPMDKIIVAFAGPLFSFLLAVAFAGLVTLLGKPQSESLSTTVIGHVAKDSAAEKSGLKPGDRVISIDGHAVRRFEGLVDSVRWGVVASEGKFIKFEVERPGEGVKKFDVEATFPEESQEPVSWWRGLFRRPPLRDVGLLGRQTPMVASVYENSPAAEAGILENDLILTANGRDLVSLGTLSDVIRESGGAPVRLTIERQGKNVELSVKPSMPDVDKRADNMKQPAIGVAWDIDGKRKLVYPGVWEQVSDSVRHMKNLIAKLFSPKSDLSPAHMSGPVGIARLYYTLFEHPDGWRMVLWFSVVFNINLAIMNLLPFPVLDGGHITMALGEMIRRRPLQGRVLEAVQTACALLLFGFIFFVTLKDAGDLFGGKGRGGKDSGPPEIRWLPKDGKPAMAK